MLIKYKKYIGAIIAFFPLCAQDAKIETLEEENKQADKAFLEWKLEDPQALDPAIKKVLTPSYSDFLVNQASLPFGVHPGQKKIDARVASVVEDFVQKIGPDAAKKIPLWELKTLVTELIKPEYIFEQDRNTRYRLDKLYNEMMETLAQRRTPAGTTLKEWALRFLIAESVIIALSALKRVTLNHKKFTQLTPRDQETLLEPVVNLVANRFIRNLEAVKDQYKLLLPDRIDDAIKYKIRLFLQAKFISR